MLYHNYRYLFYFHHLASTKYLTGKYMYMLKIQVTLIQYALWYIFQILLIFHDLPNEKIHIIACIYCLYFISYVCSSTL